MEASRRRSASEPTDGFCLACLDLPFLCLPRPRTRAAFDPYSAEHDRAAQTGRRSGGSGRSEEAERLLSDDGSEGSDDELSGGARDGAGPSLWQMLSGSSAPNSAKARRARASSFVSKRTTSTGTPRQVTAAPAASASSSRARPAPADEYDDSDAISMLSDIVGRDANGRARKVRRARGGRGRWKDVFNTPGFFPFGRQQRGAGAGAEGSGGLFDSLFGSGSSGGGLAFGLFGRTRGQIERDERIARHRTLAAREEGHGAGPFDDYDEDEDGYVSVTPPTRPSNLPATSSTGARSRRTDSLASNASSSEFSATRAPRAGEEDAAEFDEGALVRALQRAADPEAQRAAEEEQEREAQRERERAAEAAAARLAEAEAAQREELAKQAAEEAELAAQEERAQEAAREEAQEKARAAGLLAAEAAQSARQEEESAQARAEDASSSATTEEQAPTPLESPTLKQAGIDEDTLSTADDDLTRSPSKRSQRRREHSSRSAGASNHKKRYLTEAEAEAAAGGFDLGYEIDDKADYRSDSRRTAPQDDMDEFGFTSEDVAHAAAAYEREQEELQHRGATSPSLQAQEVHHHYHHYLPDHQQQQQYEGEHEQGWYADEQEAYDEDNEPLSPAALGLVPASHATLGDATLKLGQSSGEEPAQEEIEDEEEEDADIAGLGFSSSRKKRRHRQQAAGGGSSSNGSGSGSYSGYSGSLSGSGSGTRKIGSSGGRFQYSNGASKAGATTKQGGSDAGSSATSSAKLTVPSGRPNYRDKPRRGATSPNAGGSGDA